MPAVMSNTLPPSLLPYLFPDEFHKEVCLAMKGEKKQAMAYVVWQFKDVGRIQANLIDGFVNDINTLFYITPENLVELLEWVIDDNIEDDFAYVECINAFFTLSRKEIYSVTADFIEQQMFQAIRIKSNVEKVLEGQVAYSDALNIPKVKNQDALKEHLERFKKNQLIVESFMNLIK